ncbi:hypothetical protein GBF38_002378, partial [Nibea albiflora]
RKEKRSQPSAQPLSSAFFLSSRENSRILSAPSPISFYSNYTTVIKQDISGDDGHACTVSTGPRWDTLGGNEGQWDRAESVYEQQARVAGRRSSLSYGEGGGWYEPPPGVQPSDLDLKRDPYSYQDSLYGQVYADRHNPRGMRKGSVPDLNHYERAPMAHRGSISHQDYYTHDPAVTPRPP